MEHNGINKTIAIFAFAVAVTSTVITASASTFTIEGSDNSFTIRRSGDTTYFTPLGVTVNGTDGIVADANGNIFLWLPDGDWSGIVTDIVYPTYLDGAHELVKSNYVAWATSYGANINPECEGRFLLGISPATAIPEGAAMLKVVDFSFTDKVLHLELASDVCDLSQPAEWSGTPMLCNGFLTLEFAFDLEAVGTPGGDMITPMSVPVSVDESGRAVMDLDFSSEGEDLPAAMFVKPTITVKVFGLPL